MAGYIVGDRLRKTTLWAGSSEQIAEKHGNLTKDMLLKKRDSLRNIRDSRERAAPLSINERAFLVALEAELCPTR